MRLLAARTFAAADRAGHVGLADYANTGNPKLISSDGLTTWALIEMPNPDTGPYTSAQSQVAPGPSVLVATLIGAAGALVVLAFVYGSWLAIVPLLMALPTILTTFLLVGLLEKLTSVSSLVQYLIASVGLGVAIDYSLMVVTRWREERGRGLSNHDAILAAGATAGRAVILSGLTVAVALLSLVVIPVQFLQSIGYGGMLIPLVAICAAVTLLPVTLATWGEALDRHRVRRWSTTYSASWERWGAVVVRRRWFAVIVGLAIMVALAIPAASLNTAESRANALVSNAPAAHALRQIERDGVSSAVVFPIQLLTHGGPGAAAQAATIAARTPGVSTVLAPATPTFRQGSYVLLSVIARDDGTTAAGQATVARLRSALAGLPGGVQVGGNTAQNVDFNSAVYGKLPLMLGLIALVTFVLLARAFRSVALALKAVILNVISLGAAYGFIVLFWQDGHGSKLIYGVPATGGIRDWVPVVMFTFLFGLSMDYEVFLLARIREEYDRTGDTDTAVIQALARTGRLVTCAALILAISFVSLSLQPNIIVQTIATGLGVGIILDAVVVRTLLVPALASLLGGWNWWMPHPLARILRIQPSPAPNARCQSLTGVTTPRALSSSTSSKPRTSRDPLGSDAAEVSA